MTSVASVKDRLRNQAKKINRPLQEIYTAYGLERALYRLSISEYADRFVLKGGILLYALFGNDFPRVTRDIDFLASANQQRSRFHEAGLSKVFFHRGGRCSKV